ncbi:MAG: hypothetical protein DU429_02405 [Candidatus Tokpelaia sp.]|nr:MAG: hypothetical protein DU430_05155 [Candidatus Tokpelaia sp.]KAA6207336.1 MAG: hypothetical protein DU429_02405 [Candidatus Tokpelaia sp.]KAA6405151.1 hypothetical protein DPQ22_06270 [Candidatus Tokpelaia sp.]
MPFPRGRTRIARRPHSKAAAGGNNCLHRAAFNLLLYLRNVMACFIKARRYYNLSSIRNKRVFTSCHYIFLLRNISRIFSENKRAGESSRYSPAPNQAKICPPDIELYWRAVRSA